MNPCLVCKTPVETFVSFGPQPIANGFIAEKDLGREYFFEMEVAFCPECKMAQLVRQPDREQMFHENYPFFSSLSKGMVEHFRKFSETLLTKHIRSAAPFVVEMGSNDGIMLRNFQEKGIRHLGVEPSGNVAEAARAKGVDTWTEFFDEKVAEKIVAERGQADAFFTSNVFCHIPYTHSILKGIDKLLKPDGIVAFEDPYLGEIVANTTYDQVYDEHVFFFSLHSVSYLFGRHGFELFDVEPQETHGGSMRYYLARKGARPVSERVRATLAQEKELGLDRIETFRKFAKNVEASRDAFVALLRKLKSEGKRVVGYAATSKSTTILNYGKIGPELIEYICDTTPLKQGKVSPGMHIPVVPHERFAADRPDYAVLFAYNHRKEILAKEKAYAGEWITYVPNVHTFANG